MTLMNPVWPTSKSHKKWEPWLTSLDHPWKPKDLSLKSFSNVMFGLGFPNTLELCSSKLVHYQFLLFPLLWILLEQSCMWADPKEIVQKCFGHNFWGKKTATSKAVPYLSHPHPSQSKTCYGKGVHEVHNIPVTNWLYCHILEISLPKDGKFVDLEIGSCRVILTSGEKIQSCLGPTNFKLLKVEIELIYRRWIRIVVCSIVVCERAATIAKNLYW